MNFFKYSYKEKNTVVVTFTMLFMLLNFFFALIWQLPVNWIFIMSLLYFSLIFSFFIGIIFSSKPEKSFNFKNISVIVAARNESKNIEKLIEALHKQNYPSDKFEVIISNDRSSDDTAELVKKWEKVFPNLKLINIDSNEKEIHGKKHAIEMAIKKSKFDLLSFTDADCLPHKDWLREVNRHFTKDVDFVAGYSPLITSKKSKLNSFKNLERASIFGVTAGSFGMNWGITATARNMAYRKEVFYKVNGFDKIKKIPSGDDDLLLQKMRKVIRNYSFMFSPYSIVPSIDKENMKEQINLEVRRGSKFRFYTGDVKFISLFVFAFYLTLMLLIPAFFFHFISLELLIYIFGMKIITEFLLLFTFSLKIKKLSLLKYFIFAEIIYIPYFIYFGLRGTFGKYNWK